MIGIELAFPAKAVWEELIRRGFICNLSHEVVLRLLPALNIPEEICAPSRTRWKTSSQTSKSSVPFSARRGTGRFCPASPSVQLKG